MSNTVSIKASDSASATADIILFKFEGEFIPRPFGDREFPAKIDTSILFHASERREIYVGLGQRAKLSSNVYRNAAGYAIRRALKIGSTEVVIDVSDCEEHVVSLVEGAVIGAYEFDDFRSSEEKPLSLRVTLIGPKISLKGIRSKIHRGETLGNATNYVRQLGNLPGNWMTPKKLCEEASQLGQKYGLKVRTWSKSALMQEGFGGLLAVGSGSANEPRLIRIDYSCSNKNAPTLAVVGKAITFDSGGLCLKESDQMGEMIFDKMGGCSVLGIMRAAAELKPDCHIIGVLAAAENMTGSAAYRPGDIVKTYDGQTVEVVNTDAEGRIVLADALGYVRTKISPDLVIDLATLTGACVVALGEERAGLFSRDTALTRLLQTCGEDSGEPVWPLPLGEEFDSQIESKVADVRNLGKTRWGGASTAASFLSNWTRGIPHLHLDIAGPAMGGKEKVYRSHGATGFGTRLVYRFAEAWADQSKS